MIKMKKLLVVLCMFLLPNYVYGEVRYFTGHVIEVIDGDTVKILDDRIGEITIRLAGIDCPELKQEFGEEAKKALEMRVLGVVALFMAKGDDGFGRTIARVWSLPEFNDVNKILLEEGLAWYYRGYPKIKEFEDIELSARSKKLKIWSAENPVSPADFRKLKRGIK